jgi:hypothetical protein
MTGKMMRWLMSMFVLIALPSVGLAQVDARTAKIETATAHAVSAMMADISRQPLTADVAVGDLLAKTDSTDAMRLTLQEADQIGGPRWIDEQTCQVRLEIAGSKVADRLKKISESAGDRSPIKAPALNAALKGWDRRTFSAIGNSTEQVSPAVEALPATQPAAAVIDLPVAPPKWASQSLRADGKSGPTSTKLRAARLAEIDALANLRHQIDDLPATPTATLGQAAKTSPDVNQAIARAVQRARLTKVDYLADGGASVQVNLNLADLWRDLDAAR